MAYAYRRPKARRSFDKFKTSPDNIVRTSQHKTKQKSDRSTRKQKALKNNINLSSMVGFHPSTWEMEVRDCCKFETRLDRLHSQFQASLG